MKQLINLMLMLMILLLAACTSSTAAPTVASTETPTAEPKTLEAEHTPEPVEMASSLTGTSWAWVGFTDPMQKITVEDPLSYTLTFQDEGSVAVVADCNNARGSYTIDGSSLKIEIGPMTRVACPPESRSDDFVKYLGAAAIYSIKDGNLLIDLMADGGTMEFALADTVKNDDGGAIAGSLQANSWMWVSFTNPVEEYQVTDPDNYLLTFNADGTANIKADCNNAMGSYAIDGSSLKIEIGPITRAACPPGSHSDDFVKYLGAGAIYFYKDGDLYIDLMADGGTLHFSPK